MALHIKQRTKGKAVRERDLGNCLGRWREPIQGRWRKLHNEELRDFSLHQLLLLLLLLLLYDMGVSFHRPFLAGTSLEPAVNPTAQDSSSTFLLSLLGVLFQV